MPPLEAALAAPQPEPLQYDLPGKLSQGKHRVPLKSLGVYAESERRNRDMPPILGRTLNAPLHGSIFYSPGGAAVVERARQRKETDFATAKWHRAAVFSPATAILGLGVADEKDGVIMAGAAGPIMLGKSAYFLWTAGVNAEPITVETPLTKSHLRTLLHEVIGAFVQKFNDFKTTELDLEPKQLAKLKKMLDQAAEKQFLAASSDELYWQAEHRTVTWNEQKQKDFINTLLGEALKFVKRATSNQHMAFSDDTVKTATKFLENTESDMRSKLRAMIFANSIITEANNYGFINVEDARGADLSLILGMLKEANLGSAIWSDDMQGTGVITAAGILSWAHQTGRLKVADADNVKPEERATSLTGLRFIIFGAGAGAMGVYNELINNGVREEDILVTDTGPNKDYSGVPYVLHESRTDIAGDYFKTRMARGIREGTTVEEFAKGADGIINLGDEKTVTGRPLWTDDLTRKLAPKPFFGVMTNPEPGIDPATLHTVNPEAYYASGNQMYENTVNNFTAFGYIGAGALLAGAIAVTNEMTIAAAWAIHRVAKMGPTEEQKRNLPENQHQYGQHRIVPDPTDIRLINEQIVEVAVAAVLSGVSLFFDKEDYQTPEAKARLYAFFRHEAELRTAEVERLRQESVKNAHLHYKEKYPERYEPFYHKDTMHPIFYINPVIAKGDFLTMAEQLGVRETRWKESAFKEGNGDMNPKALSQALTELKQRADGDSVLHKIAEKELDLIISIARVSPALGLALAIRRLQSWERPDNLALDKKPSVFHKYRVMDTVDNVIRYQRAMRDIHDFKEWVATLRPEPEPPQPAGKPEGEAVTAAPPVGEAAVVAAAEKADGGTEARSRTVIMQSPVLIQSARALLGDPSNLVAANSDVEGTWAPVIDLRPATEPVAEAADPMVDDNLGADALDDQGIFGSAIDPTGAHVIPFVRPAVVPVARAVMLGAR